MGDWRVKLACGHVWRTEKAPKLTGPYLCPEHESPRLASIMSAERVDAPPVDRPAARDGV